MVQVPEGLKTKALEIAALLEKQGLKSYISCEPAYGACDLRDREAKELDCDALLHIGHTDFGIQPKIPVIYEPYEIEFNPLPLLERHIASLKKYKKICLLTTSQFLKSLDTTKRFLEKNKINTLQGTCGHTGIQGQVLGCDYSAAFSHENEADCFLFLGSGKFHPLGLALRTDKPVISLDFETGNLVDFSQEKGKLEKIKAFHIAQARDARTFGILLSTKAGQGSLQCAEQVKEKLEQKNKKAWILVMDEITPSKLMGMDMDILVNCACPRLNEDFSLFKKPILKPQDIDTL